MENSNHIATRNDIIFAPHVDDEVIGCFTVLSEFSVSDVYYFYDHTAERRIEAGKAAEMFGFVPHFCSIEDSIEIPHESTLHIPNIADNHIHHKLVNYLGKKYSNQLSYYSVDMNVSFDVLSVDDQHRKKTALETLFPSQKTLLDSTEKYFLFESHLDTDAKISTRYNLNTMSLTIGGSVLPYDVVEDLVHKSNGDVNKFVSMLPFREIVIEQNNSVYSFKP